MYVCSHPGVDRISTISGMGYGTYSISSRMAVYTYTYVYIHLYRQHIYAPAKSFASLLAPHAGCSKSAVSGAVSGVIRLAVAILKAPGMIVV